MIVHNLTTGSSKRVPRVTKILYNWKLDQGGTLIPKQGQLLFDAVQDLFWSSLSGETPMHGGGRKNRSTLMA